jgi:LacI family transcriptional regulator
LHEARALFKYWREQNIPYVFFNTNLSEANPLSFIGQNLFESGRVAGELMLLGKSEPAKFVVLHVNEDVHNSPHLMEKEKGFVSYCKSFSAPVEVISMNLSSAHRLSIEKAVKTIALDLSIGGVLITTSKGTSLIASLLSSYKRKDIRIIGYDLLEQNLIHLKLGAIQFLINQNPKRQTFLGVSHLANYLLFKKTPSVLDLFPLEIITKENLDSYLASEIH